MTNHSLKLLKVEFLDHGIAVSHNMPCSVCGIGYAVWLMNKGMFQPCWDCQKEGFITVKLPKWIRNYFQRKQQL